MRTTNSKPALTTLAIIAFSIFTNNAFTAIKNQDSKNDANTKKPTKQQLLAGYNFMQTKVYTQEEDLQILRLFKGLRVSDVSDGMDKAGRRELYKKLGLKPDDSVK